MSGKVNETNIDIRDRELMEDELNSFRLIVENPKELLKTAKDGLKNKREFTGAVAEAQSAVEPLDSYDEFGALLIDPISYKNEDGGKYGIPYDDNIHTGGQVIRRKQRTAAERFLRERRGVGLLADIVGSGKTFEAGVILSELAVRGKLKSLLVVVPDQMFGSWVTVLEQKFGMGEDVLYKVRKPKNEDEPTPTLADVLYKAGTTYEGNFTRPKKPLLVDMDVFSHWEFDDSFLADVIVVDEAHHLSEEQGEHSSAMTLLSRMMKVKMAAGVPYCLLLTATPHTGNLENMFRLWYFVRSKGGNPSDFESSKDSGHTREYLAERKYYRETICHNAANITEFIRNVKYEKVMSFYKDELYEYLRGKGAVKQFETSPVYTRVHIIDGFLHDDKRIYGSGETELTTESIRADVLSRIAGEYHNTLLRSIMVRQSNDLSKKKTVQNYFFFPMKKAVKTLDIDGFRDDKISIDFSAVDKEGFPKVTCDGLKSATSLKRYIEDRKPQNMPFDQAYGIVFNRIMQEWSSTPGIDAIHTKRGYRGYYTDRINETDESILKSTHFIPVEYLADECEIGGKSDYRYAYAKDILNKHKNERVIIFFDYTLDKEQSICDEVCDKLLSEPEFKKRIMIADGKVRADEVADTFNDEKHDKAILLVKDAKFTEGANLQEASVILNYQVTHDPLAMDQSIGRIFRIGQKHNVTVYSLADMNKLEGFALAYFAEIGLLSGNTGDATILAGSNSDRMVAVQCSGCKRVELMTKDEYDDRLKKGLLICTANDVCRGPDKKGTLMHEISVYDFKCSKCGKVLTRSATDGYLCFSQDGRMFNSAEPKDRTVYCSKLCAIRHCHRFTKGAMKGKCKMLEYYNKKRNAPECELIKICAQCGNRDCWDKCKLKANGRDGINGCSACEEATCSPRPFAIEFDRNEWVADCPSCAAKRRNNAGKLRPVLARTFATFISELWKFNQDGGEGFCKNLGEQAVIVRDVRDILMLDTEGEGNN